MFHESWLQISNMSVALVKKHTVYFLESLAHQLRRCAFGVMLVNLLVHDTSHWTSDFDGNFGVRDLREVST